MIALIIIAALFIVWAVLDKYLCYRAEKRPLTSTPPPMPPSFVTPSKQPSPYCRDSPFYDYCNQLSNAKARDSPHD